MTSKKFGAGFNFPGFAEPSNKPILVWDPDNPATFLELVDTINSYAGHAGKAIIVNPDESGLTVSTISIASDKNYIHVQGSPAVTWTIVHTLNKYPSVSVADSSGHIMITDVEYIDATTVKVNFLAAASGVAYLN